ncbi:hypothetical protein [Streptomyces sp. NRRL F-2664]|uniref:hypothetical protein n=1 Tax=Streptomyces sp. NRRL F-2664 TaxID=1463842 RepID=UPI00131CE093|nr:hypothetical protein [Streptomyces sp. NRRL F-2664]
MGHEASETRAGSSAESGVKAATGAIVAVVGAANPIAGIALGALKEFVDAPLLRLVEMDRARRAERGRQALAASSREAGQSLDRLVQTIETSSDLLTLMSETVQSAMATPLDEKIIALGRCLGRGVRDETTVDAERLRVRGLASIEPPEVKLLEVISRQTYPAPTGWAQDRLPGWRRPEILNELPGFAMALDASIARLTAEGLVIDDGIGRLPGDDAPDAREMWVLTDFGRDCLALLRAVSPIGEDGVT